MERVRSKQFSALIWVLVAGLLAQNLVIPVLSRSIDDQKNNANLPKGVTEKKCNSCPDPNPPTGGHHESSPPHHSHHSTPSAPKAPKCDPTPSTPSHTPSTPSDTPTPSTPSDTPTPSTPSYTPTPSTPSTPSYTPTPSTPSYTPTPSTPSYTPTPSTPSTPIDPGTPATPVITPIPPTLPSSSPFTCIYWSQHPTLIWGLLGWWGTLGNVFSIPSIPGSGSNLNALQALTNKRTDGFGALYREGTASMLNSMMTNRFPFTTTQVRNSFVSSLSSNQAAAAQANVFKKANEGRLKPRT